MKPVPDVLLSSNYRNCADLWKEQLFIVKRSNKTKYESTNKYQLVAYEAYLFFERTKLFSGGVRPHIFAGL